MATGKKPFHHFNTRNEFISQVIRGGYRPPLDNKKWPKGLRALLDACWHHNPDKRPVSSGRGEERRKKSGFGSQVVIYLSPCTY